jgi:hypothetical protein
MRPYFLREGFLRCYPIWVAVGIHYPTKLTIASKKKYDTKDNLSCL